MMSAMVLQQLDYRRPIPATGSVARALLLSVLMHGVIFGALELGYQTGFWNLTLLFSKEQARKDAELIRALHERQQEQEMPLIFVEVDPSQATPDSTQDAQYYSSLNSRAANPEPKSDLPTPKIDGKQDKVPQTMDRSTPGPTPLQPAPEPPPPQVVETKPEPQPTPPPPKPAEPERAAPPLAQAPGDLAYSRPRENPPVQPNPKPRERVAQPQTQPPRPRTLQAARRESGGMAGEKVKQQGGAKRFALVPSFDARATPFGAYDALLIAAIQKRWYDLLASRDFAANYSGKVVLEFRLNSDGRVTDMKISENGVTEILGLLCQRAVQDPAPFDPWPSDLKRLVGKDFREVRFTFYYN